MLNDFRIYLISQDRSPLTIRGYISDLEVFARWIEKTNGLPLSPATLTHNTVREYKHHMQSGQKARPATINRHLAALRAYVAWARGSGLLDHNPLIGLKIVKTQKLAPKWLTKPEQAALLQVVQQRVLAAHSSTTQLLALRDQAIVQVLLNTGLRVSELCDLELRDIEQSEHTGLLRVRSGKGGKERTLPLNQPARTAISAWLNVHPSDSNLLLAGYRSTGMSPSAVHRRLSELGELAKVKLSAHTLRHTFAKNLVDGGVTLEKVATLLGHSSLDTTQIYITPSLSDLERSVQVLEK
jgi:integrase/recombinase XerC